MQTFRVFARDSKGYTYNQTCYFVYFIELLSKLLMTDSPLEICPFFSIFPKLCGWNCWDMKNCKMYNEHELNQLCARILFVWKTASIFRELFAFILQLWAKSGRMERGYEKLVDENFREILKILNAYCSILKRTCLSFSLEVAPISRKL